MKLKPHHGHLPRTSHGVRRAMRGYRIFLGLTQAELGARLGLRQVRVSEIEVGLVDPDEDLRNKIAEFFGVPPAEIFPEFTKGAEEEPS